MKLNIALGQMVLDNIEDYQKVLGLINQIDPSFGDSDKFISTAGEPLEVFFNQKTWGSSVYNQHMIQPYYLRLCFRLVTECCKDDLKQIGVLSKSSLLNIAVLDCYIARVKTHRLLCKDDNEPTDHEFIDSLSRLSFESTAIQKLVSDFGMDKWKILAFAESYFEKSNIYKFVDLLEDELHEALGLNIIHGSTEYNEDFTWLTYKPHEEYEDCRPLHSAPNCRKFDRIELDIPSMIRSFPVKIDIKNEYIPVLKITDLDLDEVL